jgi:PAS domain S-box-containing protein
MKFFPTNSHFMPLTHYRRLVLVLVVTVVYSFIFINLYPSKGAAIGSLSVVPVIVISWFFGVRAGIVATAFMVPLNGVLAQSTGDSTWYMGLLRGSPGFVAELLVGATVGRLHDLRLQVKQELHHRTQIEFALRESKERYRILSELVSDYAFSMRINRDKTWRYEWVSESFTRVTEFTQIDLNKNNSFLLAHPEDRELAFQQFQKVLEGQSTSGEYRIVTSKGGVRWISMHYRPIWDAQQHCVIRCYGVAQDITERKQAEGELAKLYNATSFLFNAASVLDLGQQIVQGVIQAFQQVDCGLLLVDKKQNQILRLARAGEYDVNTTASLYIDGPGLVARAVRLGEIVYASDVTADPDYLPNEPRTRSELVIPLQTPKGVIGVLDLQSDKTYAFTQQDQRILIAFAERAAAALEVMLLYEEINRHVEELEWRVTKRTAELQEAKERVEVIVAHSSDAILVVDAEGTIQQANPTLTTLFGYQADEVLEHLLTMLIEPTRREAFTQVLYTAVGTQQSHRVELAVRRKDGTLFDADFALAPIHEPDTEKVALICSVRDITERKRFEQHLQDSETRYRELFEGIDDAIFVHDADANILDVNEAACRRLGYSRDELLHMKTTAIDSPSYAEGFQNRLTHQFSEGKLSDISGVHIARNGSVIFVDVNTKLINYHGQSAILAVMRDITQRKQMDEELRLALQKEKELNELKSRFVSMVSHEFRTPLSTILSTTETLKHYGEKLSDERKLSRLDKIIDQVQHLTAMLNDILTLSRAEKVGMNFTPIRFDLISLCREIIEEIQLNDDNKHQIMIAHQGSYTEFVGDEKLLRHIVTNLITNAIKYSPPETKVEFELNRDTNEGVVIRVTDHGIGIPEEDQKHLFEAFHRATNVGTTLGTGLGLAIAKQAAESHGGTITVESTVGVGTTFIVTLPIYQVNV